MSCVKSPVASLNSANEKLRMLRVNIKMSTLEVESMDETELPALIIIINKRNVKQDLSLVTVSPALENTLSAGVDVAGTQRFHIHSS